VQALEALSDDEERYDVLVARGLARARQFAWQRTAELTAEVYRTLLG
jgi:glycosyltransferase involved in cell wall biosynthesis